MKKIIIIVLFAVASIVLYNSNCEAVRNRQKPEISGGKLYGLGESDISPRGKLAKILNIGSEYTELQREDLLNKIKDTVIAWRLPVYEIKRNNSNDDFIVFTMGDSDLVGCVIYLEVFNEKQRNYVHSLKTGSIIEIKGMITGETSFRNLIIKPAILIGKAGDLK